MTNEAFMLMLANCSEELLGTIRNWSRKPEVEEVLGPLEAEVRALADSVRASTVELVPSDIAQTVWALADALDTAAEAIDPEVASDVSVISGTIREFCLSHGLTIGPGGQLRLP